MSIVFRDCSHRRRRRDVAIAGRRAARRHRARRWHGQAADDAAQAQKPDTTKKARASVSLDFQDQELKVVLDALAAAGELNVSLTNIPQQRVTLHMGKPVTRDAMTDLVKTSPSRTGSR